VAGRLDQRGYQPPERLQFLRLLTKILPAESVLHTAPDGHYPATDLLLIFDWLGQRVEYRMPASQFIALYPHLNAVQTQDTLIHRTLQRVYSQEPVDIVDLGDSATVDVLQQLTVGHGRGW
jgi:hypothetical protein